MNVASQDLANVQRRLERLYGTGFEQALALISASIDRFTPDPSRDLSCDAPFPRPLWNQADVVLITYGDQIYSDSEASGEETRATPLQSLGAFLQEWDLPELISTVHLLPFFPSSSDDGFAVIDYRAVDPALGDWSDVQRLGQQCDLMFDFVVNHVSQQSDWFQKYLAGTQPYDRFFIEADPASDLSAVTRPRSLPLLHEFETSAGKKWIWTTFSRDQVDLNYAEPRLLAEVIDIFLEYVQRGARIIRLDAIAYLWKRMGTNCIHLAKTHEVVKLFRDIASAVAPHVVILTETNVPHDENVSYFGRGDEAHMVYQFSLPPLLLDAFLHQDARPLKNWLVNLEQPPTGATYFNFTASHDGIGVRPLEGRVDAQRLDSLVMKIKQRGGLVSTRRQPDGSDSPYELNISYFDALADELGDRHLQLQRFLASQAFMMALQGVPAIYFHSLVGTPNDTAGVARSGIHRRINRRKYGENELRALLISEDSPQRSVFQGMQQLLRVRKGQPAFHPDAQQKYVESGLPTVIALERRCPRTGQRILVAVNVGIYDIQFQVPLEYAGAVDLLGGGTTADNRIWNLTAAQTIWLEARR